MTSVRFSWHLQIHIDVSLKLKSAKDLLPFTQRTWDSQEGLCSMKWNGLFLLLAQQHSDSGEEARSAELLTNRRRTRESLEFLTSLADIQYSSFWLSSLYPLSLFFPRLILLFLLLSVSSSLLLISLFLFLCPSSFLIPSSLILPYPNRLTFLSYHPQTPQSGDYSSVQPKLSLLLLWWELSHWGMGTEGNLTEVTFCMSNRITGVTTLVSIICWKHCHVFLWRDYRRG
jgi:hypothetical protein